MGTWAAGGGRGDHLGPESLSGDAVISQAQKLKSQGMTTCRRPHRKGVRIGSETEKENEKDGDVREREAVGVGGKPGEGQGWGNSQGIRSGEQGSLSGPQEDKSLRLRTRGGEGRPATLRLVSDSGCSSSGVGEGGARDPGVAVSQKMAPEGSEAWPCW